MDLIQGQSQRDADGAAKTAEGHEEVVAEVKNASHSPRQREAQVVDKKAQEDDDNENGDGFVEDEGWYFFSRRLR